MFSNKTKTARKGGWLTLFGVICYNHCGHCYIRRSDPLFLSRSLRQEGGGACAEKGFSAFRMYSNSAVHFLYKSALTARLVPKRSMTKKIWLKMGLTAVTASLCLYYSIRSGFVKATGPGRFIQSGDTVSVVSCRICSFYIKFQKAEQFKPYSMPFDVFYSNLKYSRTILTRSVKNRLSCRSAGGRPGLPAAHSQIALNSSD